MWRVGVCVEGGGVCGVCGEWGVCGGWGVC